MITKRMSHFFDDDAPLHGLSSSVCKVDFEYFRSMKVEASQEKKQHQLETG